MCACMRIPVRDAVRARARAVVRRVRGVALVSHYLRDQVGCARHDRVDSVVCREILFACIRACIRDRVRIKVTPPGVSLQPGGP